MKGESGIQSRHQGLLGDLSEPWASTLRFMQRLSQLQRVPLELKPLTAKKTLERRSPKSRNEAAKS